MADEITKADFFTNRDNTIRTKEGSNSSLGGNLDDVLGDRKTGREVPLHRIKIDNTFIGGYGTYSFYIQKTYAKEPERSTSGAIDNLDSYVTFLTPTVRLKFNAMSMTQYCELIKLMHSKNEFQVTCYDIVYGQERTFNAYFSPDDYPELFVLDLEMLAVLNYEIELIGTNTDLNTYSITYHLNAPDGTDRTVASSNYPFGQEVIIGQEAESLKTLSGWNFQGWKKDKDKEEQDYADNTAIILNGDLVLYAHWVASTSYTLSYNYGIGAIQQDSDGKDIISRTVIYQQPINVIPISPKPSVSFLDVDYDGEDVYESQNWYWTPQPATNSTPVQSTEVYNVLGNSTIYQIFKPKTFTVTFEYTKDGVESRSVVSGEYGSSIAKPSVLQGNQKWYVKQVNGESVSEVEFSQSTMPPANVVVYAK